jgi:OOP family OmpA-OmpF porin
LPWGGAAHAGPYYDPSNAASNSGKTTGFELYKTIGCPGRGLLDPPCPGDVAAAPVARPAPAPVPAAKPADSDGDGVTDDKDRCPNTPKGAKVNADGCELDGDGDGVVDVLDQCPGTPAGDKVDAKGCSLPKVIVLHGVNFDNDMSNLRPDAIAILDQAVATLKANPSVTVEIGGHTDSRNSDWYNLGLGERCAKAVMQYLISQGVEAGRLSVRSYGESAPIADNETEEGRMKNRRVELKILN